MDPIPSFVTLMIKDFGVVETIKLESKNSNFSASNIHKKKVRVGIHYGYSHYLFFQH